MVLLIVFTIGVIVIGFISDITDGWCDLFGIPLGRWNWPLMWTWIIGGWVIAILHESGFFQTMK